MTGPVVTVADAMLRRPVVHPAGLTIAEARAVFAASPKIRLLLLVRGEVLVSTLSREDLEDDADDAAPAAGRGSLDGRTVAVDVPLEPTREAMLRRGTRRLAVVATDGRLMGLLCLKRTRTGFCTDDGVAAMRRSRSTG